MFGRKKKEKEPDWTELRNQRWAEYTRLLKVASEMTLRDAAEFMLREARHLTRDELFRFGQRKDISWDVSDNAKWGEVYSTSFYWRASDLLGVSVTVEGLSFHIGYEYHKDGGYSHYFLRMPGICPKCQQEALSSPIHGLIDLGRTLAEFTPDKMFHDCPVLAEEKRRSDVEKAVSEVQAALMEESE